MPDIVHLHRVIASRPEKIDRAFIEPDAIASWMQPYGYLCIVHELNAKVGGKQRVSFRNFTSGHVHSFGGEHLELAPNEKFVYTDKPEDLELPGEMKGTVTLRVVSVGTDIRIKQADVPDLIPLEICYIGWQDSLRMLAELVEPDINI